MKGTYLAIRRLLQFLLNLSIISIVVLSFYEQVAYISFGKLLFLVYIVFCALSCNAARIESIRVRIRSNSETRE